MRDGPKRSEHAIAAYLTTCLSTRWRPPCGSALPRRTASRSGLALVLGLAVESIQPALAAGVKIDVARRYAAVIIQASAVLAADQATAWRVLTDYERYVTGN